jgi:hypothetical protein
MARIPKTAKSRLAGLATFAEAQLVFGGPRFFGRLPERTNTWDSGITRKPTSLR